MNELKTTSTAAENEVGLELLHKRLEPPAANPDEYAHRDRQSRNNEQDRVPDESTLCLRNVEDSAFFRLFCG